MFRAMRKHAKLKKNLKVSVINLVQLFLQRQIRTKNLIRWENICNLKNRTAKNVRPICHFHMMPTIPAIQSRMYMFAGRVAIYLLRTQNKNIAKFALKHPLIRAAILQLIEKEVHKECQDMCRESIKVPVDGQNNAQTKPKSRRDLFQSSQKRKAEDQNLVAGNIKKFVKKDVRSILKRTSKDLMNFTFEKANEELQERCPLFWRILKAASRPHNMMDKVNSDVYLSTSIVTAASVCLKNRSQRMTTIQLLISLIINHSSYTVRISVFNHEAFY